METYVVIAGAAIVILSAPVCAFFILLQCFPHYLVRYAFIFRQINAGMKIKFIGNESFVFCYGEKHVPRPDRPSILFIHGFSSSKDQWISCFKGFPKDLHLLALDLPGHGASSIPGADVKLDLNYVVDAVATFLNLVGLEEKKVHFIGSSLGGAIVGCFAARYPERVEKLTMVCPAMQTPIDSDFAIQVRKVVEKGVENMSAADCKLLPTDVPSMKAMLDACCYNKNVIKFGDQICKGVLLLRLPKTGFYLKLFKAITETENLGLLINTAPSIKAPTQLIWGEQDEVIHVSGAELLRSKLSNCQRVDIIDKCGHAIDIDRPGAFMKYLLLFIQSDVINDDNWKNK